MTNPAREIPLLFIRHGATAWNAAGRYQGRKDPHLSPEGRRDAVRLALQLSDAEIELVISSPLSRARETASLIASAKGAPLSLDDRLLELNYGDWEGLTQAQAKALWPEQLRSWKRDIANARPPGGETLGELALRIEEFLRGLRSRAPRGAVAIVAHDLVVRVALLALRGEGVGAVRELSVPTATVHPARLLASACVPSPREAMSGVVP